MAAFGHFVDVGGGYVVVDVTGAATTATLIERVGAYETTAMTWVEMALERQLHRERMERDLVCLDIRRFVQHEVVPLVLAEISPKNWRWFHCFRPRLELACVRFPVLDRRPILSPPTAPSRLDRRRQKRKKWLQK